MPEMHEVRALRGEVADLHAALDSNRLIGTAVGLLMGRHHLDRRAAFAYLVRLSQNTNVKLGEVARAIVDQAEDQLAADGGQ